MKETVCCFTGHRFLPRDELPGIERRLELVIQGLIEKGVIHYGCGGAIGFDLLAGEMVLKLKKRFPSIKLIMVLPCEDQDKKWQQSDKDRYRALLDSCDKAVYVTREYKDGCMLQRNRHLVDHSSVCVAYLVQQSGGSYYTVNYAHRRRVTVINIAEPMPALRL